MPLMGKHTRYFDNHYIQDSHDFMRLRTQVYNHPDSLVDVYLNRAVTLLHACSENSMRLLSVATGPPTHSRDLRRLGHKLYNGELAGFGYALHRTAKTLSILRSETAPSEMMSSTIASIGDLQCRFHVNERDLRSKPNWAAPDSDLPLPLVKLTTMNQAINHCEALAVKVMKLCAGACNRMPVDRDEIAALPVLKTFLESDLGSRAFLHRLMLPAYEERPIQTAQHPFEAEFRSAMDATIKVAIGTNRVANNEILYGRAGVLYTLLFLFRHCHEYEYDHAVADLARCLLDAGADFARRTETRFPLYYEWHGSDYLGAAHGLAGILHILLQVEVRDDDLRRRIELVTVQSVELLLNSLQMRSGNFPTRLNASRIDDNDSLVQWCHGSPGVLALLCRVRHLNSDLERPLTAAINRAVEDIWNRGLLRKGVGLCHGIAGNGYAFLRDPGPGIDRKVLLVKAVAFAEIGWAKLDDLFAVPDNPFSLYEGIAGFICYLLDVALALCDKPILGMPGFDL